jgi:hypothetical protein
MLRQWPERDLVFHKATLRHHPLQPVAQAGLDQVMLKFWASHWNNLSATKLMIDGAGVFREFTELLDGQ